MELVDVPWKINGEYIQGFVFEFKNIVDNFLKEAITIYVYIYYFYKFEISNVNWNELIRDQNFEEYKEEN